MAEKTILIVKNSSFGSSCSTFRGACVLLGTGSFREMYFIGANLAAFSRCEVITNAFLRKRQITLARSKKMVRTLEERERDDREADEAAEMIGGSKCHVRQAERNFHSTF